MFERFTTQARDVVVGAQHEARQLRHPCVGTEHLLLTLLASETGIPHRVLRERGVDARRLRTEIERLVGTPPKILSDEDAAALQTIGIDAHAVLARIEQSFGADALTPACSRPRRRLLGRRRVSTRFTRRAKKVLELSLREAVWLHHSYIGAEHILLGLLREGVGLIVEILTRAGLSRDELRRATLAELNKAA
jgi:ATP-dependent Clp protease ATP-binding subunit ClpA